MSGKAGECRRRPRRYQVDPWSRGQVARGVLRSSPKPEKRPIFCHRRGIVIFCRLFSTQQRPNALVSDAWPAPATSHRSLCEHCNQGVGRSPKERAPFRFHGAVVGFVDRCLSRTRNLAASNKRLAEFFSGQSWPRSAQDVFFQFFSKICAHSERYRNLLARIFEILTFYGNIAFLLSPVLSGIFFVLCLVCFEGQD